MPRLALLDQVQIRNLDLYRLVTNEFLKLISQGQILAVYLNRILVAMV